MESNGNKNDSKEKPHSWSLKEDKKVCDDLEAGKENVLSQVKQLEQNLNQTSQTIQQLSSYVESVHATLAASSYSRFLEQGIAEDVDEHCVLVETKYVREVVASMTTFAPASLLVKKQRKEEVPAFEVLRTAINSGIEKIANLSHQITTVSSLPELISKDSTKRMNDELASKNDEMSSERSPDVHSVNVNKCTDDSAETLPPISHERDSYTCSAAISSAPDTSLTHLGTTYSATAPTELDRSFLLPSSASDLLGPFVSQFKPGTTSSGDVQSEKDTSLTRPGTQSAATAPSELNHSFLLPSSASDLSSPLVSKNKLRTTASGDVQSEKDTSLTRPGTQSSATAPSELNRSFLLPSSASDLSGPLVSQNKLGTTASGDVLSERDTSLTHSGTTHSATAPSELNRSFLLPSSTSDLSGFSQFKQGIIASGDVLSEKDTSFTQSRTKSSATVPSELNRSFLLPSSALDLSEDANKRVQPVEEVNVKKEDIASETSTDVFPKSLYTTKVSEKYKSIFDDEDDDDDLFDIKTKKTPQKDRVGASTKVPPKKLPDSNFSKLLGEKLSRGPVQQSVSKVTTASSSANSDSTTQRVAASRTAEKKESVDVEVVHETDSFKPLHSIVKERTRGPARRPPSKKTNTTTPHAEPVKPPTEDVKKLSVLDEVVTVSKTELVETAVEAKKPKSSGRIEGGQRSAVQSFFDADSDENEEDKEEILTTNKTEQHTNVAATVKLPAATAKTSSSITAQSLFADDDESDLSIFRKK